MMYFTKMMVMNLKYQKKLPNIFVWLSLVLCAKEMLMMNQASFGLQFSKRGK